MELEARRARRRRSSGRAARRRRRHRRRRACRPRSGARRTGTPSADARSGLRRIVISDRPNGECTIAARQQEQHEQRRRGCRHRRCGRTRSNSKWPSSWRHHDALQAVGAAGDVRRSALATSPSTSATPSVTIRRVRSLPRSTRKLVSEAQRPRRPRWRRRAPASGSRGDVLGQKAGGVGADAEEGGVAQRDDAGIAQDQVEREREQGEDRDLVQDQVLARRQEQRGEGQQPEHDLGPAPARRAARGLAAAVIVPRSSCARANRPCGRSTSTTIMHEIDDEGAERRQVIFAGDVGHAQQQRGERTAR